MIKLKRFIAIAILICVCTGGIFYSSCGVDTVPSSENNNTYLKEILADYRKNGVQSRQDILAVYNADENPLDYKNFDEVLAVHGGFEYEDKDGNEIEIGSEVTYANMTDYCIITDIAVIIGADEGYFGSYKPYLRELKELVENMSSSREEVAIDTYCFAYYALKGANIAFDESKFVEYIKANQKADGGFALSGSTGDIDITAQVFTALVYLSGIEDFNMLDCCNEAAKYIGGKENDDSTFSNSKGERNSVSTAYVLDGETAFLYQTYGDGNLSANNVRDALALFKAKKETGYSYLSNKNKSDADATSAAAIAISSVKNKMSVWSKLMEEAKETEPVL
jgi:hypothetical protein